VRAKDAQSDHRKMISDGIRWGMLRGLKDVYRKNIILPPCRRRGTMRRVSIGGMGISGLGIFETRVSPIPQEDAGTS
jgi:hypothetical protein